MTMLHLILRQLRRGFVSGELRILALALILALAALSAVGFFTDRLRTGLLQQAGESLAADLVVRSSEPIPARFKGLADKANMQTAMIVGFPTVIVKGNETLLVDIHAVSRGYPLRGQVRIAPVAFGTAHPTSAIPAPGSVWVAPRVLTHLRLKVGDHLNVGSSKMRIAAVISYLPDGGWGFRALAPKLIINIQDLAATGLVSNNARITYRLLMAGSPPAVSRLKDKLNNMLTPGLQLEDSSNVRPEITSAVERAKRFLGLAALVSVLVSAVAIILAARRYSYRYTDTIAVLKCLGMSKKKTQLLLLGELWVLGLIAGLLGVACGYFAQEGLVRLLRELLPASLPAATMVPALSALAFDLILLAGFALPPLMHIAATPPARVLRRDFAPPPLPAVVVYGAALAAAVVLVWWQSGDTKLSLYVLAGIGGTIALLFAGAGLLLFLLRPLRYKVGSGWRYGLVSLLRRSRETKVQMVAFGLGIMILLLLTIVRTDLLTGWRNSLPADTPNQFIINIQPGQRDTVKQFFQSRGIPAPRLFPVVRGRLAAINDRAVEKIRFSSARARHMANRGANLSWSATLPAGNRIIAGHWWPSNNPVKGLASVEQEHARLLGVKPGDTLTYDIAGDKVKVRIASLRKVHWDSFHPNFFVDVSPRTLEGYPVTYITSMFLPAEKAPVLADLVRKLPALTIFDIDAILARIHHLINRVTLAVEYVFLFTLGAGVVVLMAAVQSSRDERRFEAAVLRTLGASGRHLKIAVTTEYAVLGVAAGLLAAAAASVIAWFLATRLFSLAYHLDPVLWISGVGLGALLVSFSGLAATYRTIRAPAVESLRNQ